MTVRTTGRPTPSSRRPAPYPRRPAPPARRPAPPAGSTLPGPRRLPGVRAGQVVAAQVAVALPVAAVGHGSLLVGGALLLGSLLLLVGWVRVRQRWLFEWIGTGLGYLGRGHTLPAGTGPAGLLALVEPTATVLPAELAGDPAALIADASGVTAVLELGDPGDPLGDGPRDLPAPLSLLPEAGPDSPPLTVQLLLTAVPAPAPAAGEGSVATSYRQLTDGLLAGQERALLAVRVLRVAGWSDPELHRALSSAVRRIVRRLGPVTARPLGEAATLRVLAELAHHDAGQPVRESWPAIRLGGLLQSTFRLHRWPGPGTEAPHHLVPRLLALPATATTVSVVVGPHPVAGATGVPAELTVRLAAADPAELSIAAQALHRLVALEGATLHRLDGEQVTGVGSTLPLARIGPGTHRSPLSATALGTLDPCLGTAGLMIGANRRGAAVAVRLFRPQATWLMLVGALSAAQLVVLRAMALGARVVVRTARPRRWEPFVRAVSRPGATITVLPPGRAAVDPAASPLRPLLLVVDAGPVPAPVGTGPAWQATLVVRDRLTPADAEALARADLAVLQPLDPAGAALAGNALGLAESAQWLTRIRDDMVAVVNRRALRWALLSPTPIESHLVDRGARD